MSKALAYCGYLHGDAISLPEAGVGGASVQMISQGRLCVLWSQTEWPFAANALQQSAIEFHGVVNHIFQQKAVAPFQLLTVFDSQADLAEFAAHHEKAIVADLERLQDCVQMECVLYVIGARRPADAQAPRERPQYDADALLRLEKYAGEVCATLNAMSREVKVRAETTSRRIFALVERGQEPLFQQMLQDMPLPALVSRRFKGPRPAAEFFSVLLETPRKPERP